MSQSLSGWSVQPTFVPGTPAGPATLVFDDAGLTQYVGSPAVVWQIPWPQVSSLQLVRHPRGVSLMAIIGGVRYHWRHAERAVFSAVRPEVERRGGTVTTDRRFLTLLVVGLLVLAACSAGFVGARSSSSATPQEVNTLKAINISPSDLGAGWSIDNASILSALAGSPNFVYYVNPATTSTAPPAAVGGYAMTEQRFWSCMGLTSGHDRIFGTAGQLPEYQIGAEDYTSKKDGGIEVSSLAQYYPRTSMVNADTAEMIGHPRFSACYIGANANLAALALGEAPHYVAGHNATPVTFAQGFHRGGVIALTHLTPATFLVVDVATSGHYEISLCALVHQWPQSKSFLDGLLNIMMARISTRASSAI